MRPVTVRASTMGDIGELQQRGLDNIVEYLTKVLQPGILLPVTARIVIEWGDEFVLEELRKDTA